jgi:ankyrin repeat protein
MLAVLQIVVCDLVNFGEFKKNTNYKSHAWSNFVGMPSKTKLLSSCGIALCVLFCWPVLTQALQQAPVSFSDQEALSHRILPAREIHTKRTSVGRSSFEQVTLNVVVTPSGRVESAKAINGPKEFYAEAELIEKEHVFKPFEKNGVAVRASVEDYVWILPPVQWAAKKVPFPEIKNWNSLRITLERTTCFGTCPAYSVEIRGDGSVTFDGRSFALISGVHHEKIPSSTVVSVVNKFQRADYFSLKDKYATNATDSPTFTTSIEFDGNKKQVIDYIGLQSGMPEIVEALEDSVDEAAGTQKWLKGTSDTWPSLLAENWNFKADTKENSELFASVLAHGSSDLIQKFVSAGILTADFGKNSEGLLVNAASRGDANMVSRLVMRQEPFSAPLLFRALRAAAGSGSLATVDILLRKGANVKGNRSDDDGDHSTVLMAAARSGNADVVREILKHHPDLTVLDFRGDNVIASRLRLGRNLSDPKPIIEALVAAGVDVNAGNEDDETAIFAACFDPRGVKPLAAADANLNAKNGVGSTALMTCDDPEFAKQMIQAGANLFAKNRDGLTAAQAARRSGHDGIADILDAAMKTKRQPQ